MYVKNYKYYWLVSFAKYKNKVSKAPFLCRGEGKEQQMQGEGGVKWPLEIQEKSQS